MHEMRVGGIVAWRGATNSSLARLDALARDWTGARRAGWPALGESGAARRARMRARLRGGCRRGWNRAAVVSEKYWRRGREVVGADTRRADRDDNNARTRQRLDGRCGRRWRVGEGVFWSTGRGSARTTERLLAVACAGRQEQGPGSAQQGRPLRLPHRGKPHARRGGGSFCHV